MAEALNSWFMYLICGGIIAFIAVVCVIFMVRAYRAGLELGMDPQVLKNTVTSSVSFSILPSIGILLGVIALSGSLGIPWPWLRLSVIGALHYEVQVAQGAAEQVGMHTLSMAEMTPESFSTICLLMSVCIVWGMILSIFFNKKYTERLGGPASGGKPGKAAGFGDVAMTAMFIGLVSAYLGSYIGGLVSGGTGIVPIITVLVSGAVMGVFIWLSEKKGLRAVDNFSVAGAMLAGMLAAVIVS